MYFKVKVVIFTVLSLFINILPIHCQFTKRFESLLKISQRLKTMNCRIVDAICQHNFVQTQTVLVSFQRKEALFFLKKKLKDGYIN